MMNQSSKNSFREQLFRNQMMNQAKMNPQPAGSPVPQAPVTNPLDSVEQATPSFDFNRAPEQSYNQQKRRLGEQDYDITEILTYEQGLDYVKGYLKKELKDTLEDTLRQRAQGVIIKKDKTFFKKRLAEYTEKVTEVVHSNNLRFYGHTHESFIKMCVSEVVGWDILDDAFADDGITDIYVYRWDKIYVEKDGVNQYYPRKFRNEKHYQDFLDRLKLEADAKFDKGSHKIADFDLFEDRFCAVNQVVAPGGSSLTIRKHAESHVRLSQIIEKNGMDEVMAELFRLIFKGQCSLIYAGITGSGKTTTLRALADAYITDLNRRVLTCEDTRELFLENQQTLELVTVKGNQGKGDVKLENLITTALRLKPKYIMVGEVRSLEAEAAVEAAATGHSTCFTMHAEKPIDTVNRLVTNYQKAMPQLQSDQVECIIGAAVDFVAIQKNIPGVGRRVVSITEINFDFETRRVKLIPIMSYDYKSDTFKVLNAFSEDVVDKMLGSGVRYDEMEAWLAHVPEKEGGDR